ncbi:MAG TPA: TIGR03790 family protein [Acidobacteriaceae bacterium]|nr:TIGR03790 family protein [Acidobacteriaceae bacterium]
MLRVIMISLVGVASGYTGASATIPTAHHTAGEVLLVYNADSPVSTAVAKYYAAKRGVMKTVVVHCADSAVSTEKETILLADYNREIADPVSKYLARHKEINFIVLTKGVPIRVRGGETGSHDENLPASAPLNASVDSYLATMDYATAKVNGKAAVKISIHGSGASGFGWLNRYWKADVPFSHAAYGGYLVTRLDGYTEADAKALVDRAVAAETTKTPSGKMPGKVLLDVQPIFKFKSTDVASQPLDVTGNIPDESDYGSWNADMVKAGDLLIDRKIPIELDRDETFIGERTNLLGYFSWGSNDKKFTGNAYESLRFVPGAISDTAVSTSARTFLPTTGGQSLIIDLIAHGVTGVKGYTDEPLLQAIASPSIVMERYTSGFTLAESFYAASRFVGWTDIVIGDPLCRPAYWIPKASR